MLIMKESYIYGWGIFVLFHVCACKLQALSPRQKDSFSTLTTWGSEFSPSQTGSLGAMPFPFLCVSPEYQYPSLHGACSVGLCGKGDLRVSRS